MFDECPCKATLLTRSSRIPRWRPVAEHFDDISVSIGANSSNLWICVQKWAETRQQTTSGRIRDFVYVSRMCTYIYLRAGFF